MFSQLKSTTEIPIWLLITSHLLIATAGIIFSVSLKDIFFPEKSLTANSLERRESGYMYINPLLECELFENQGNTQLREMKEKVEDLVQKKQNQVISLYYRDLLNGPWYGFHEDESFSPQSLLKIPVVIAYLKLSENNPALLQQTIPYKNRIESNLPNEQDLVVGENYQIKYLIERSLKLSDNVAFNLLVENIPDKYLIKVHQDLNITYPSETTPDDFVSVRSYSSIFRILYNASYLSRESSEYLLSVLTDTDFDEGLVAGVPKNTPVAHKFGVKNADDTHLEYQLHDCGIVYQTNKPYLLCVMTKGNNQSELKKTIEEISRIMYELLVSQGIKR